MKCLAGTFPGNERAQICKIFRQNFTAFFARVSEKFRQNFALGNFLNNLFFLLLAASLLFLTSF